LKNWGNLIGKSPENVSVSKETKRLWLDNNRRAFKGETVFDEVVYNGLDKGKKYYYNIITPIRDDEKIYGILGILINISKLKQAEEALRESHKRFRNLTEVTTDWIWETDKNDFYTYVSPKIQDILGYSEEEILGKTPFELMPPEEAGRVSKIFDTIRASQRPFYCIENINLHKNGQSVVLESSGLPIFNSYGEFCGYRGIDRNITRRKRTEAELREARDGLEIRVKERTRDLETALRIIKEREKEIEQRKSTLEQLNQKLMETNQALSILARNIDRDKEVMEKRIIKMIQIKIMPIINELKKDKGCQKRLADLEVLNTYMDDIIPESTFYNDIETSLSEQEMRVMVMVKNGMTSQKIADMLNISIDTVKTHRKNIRKKLKLHNSKINLSSYLKSKFRSD
jgi:PAS domain S-box-containing protein